MSGLSVSDRSYYGYPVGDYLLGHGVGGLGCGQFGYGVEAALLLVRSLNMHHFISQRPP
jgi:hypothetical protein